MKRLSRLSLTFLIASWLMITLLSALPLMLNHEHSEEVKAQQIAQTTLRILPENITGVNLNENFTVFIVIENVLDLYGFDIQLRWDPSIIHCVGWELHVPVEDYPDGVLHETAMVIKNVVDESASIPGSEPGAMGWWAATSLAPAEPFSGNGTVVTLTFQVVGQGSCKIEFVRTSSTPMLTDPNGSPIPFEAYDANFVYSEAPTAVFSYWPSVGVKGAPVIFNASESVSNAGKIVSYIWSFGDGNITKTAQPVINHVYIEAGDYEVMLTVVNDKNVSSTPYKKIVKILEYRDIKVANVYASPSYVEINQTVFIEVKVANLEKIGVTENCSIAVYYNHTAISLTSSLNLSDWTFIIEKTVQLQPTQEKSFIFEWNTAGWNITEGSYYFLATVKKLPYERNATDNMLITENPIYMTKKVREDLAILNIEILAKYGDKSYQPPAIYGEDIQIKPVIYNNSTRPEANYTVTILINGSKMLEKYVTSSLDPQRICKEILYRMTKPNAGLYNITATLYFDRDENLANNRVTTFVNVVMPPELNITWSPKSITVNQTVTFFANESVKDSRNRILNYTWILHSLRSGKNIYLNGKAITVQLPTEGNWTVTLIVTDSFGIKYSPTREMSSGYSVTVTIEVKPIPPNLLVDYLAIAAVITVIVVLAIFYHQRSKKLSRITEDMFEGEDDIIEF